MSNLIRLWHFLSSVNSFFKHPCSAIQWGQMSIFGWLCWGLTSQSTIFQSCRDGAIASWVINQYFRGVKCLAQGHNTAAVGLEPRTSRSGVRHSTTEPPRSPCRFLVGPIVYFHTSCVRTAKALARLRRCAGSSEPSLVAYVISTVISWDGSFVDFV